MTRCANSCDYYILIVTDKVQIVCVACVYSIKYRLPL
nr:MAG TPA: hypothetical protein [Caudoviricetes sp.]